ncbi:MAG TPA: hypothetical protein VEQ60_20065 [Longimicrobium sp.]|nr:hypothetical protein [Longimicrobium sp.]
MKTIARLFAVLLMIAATGCTRYRTNALPAPEEGPVSLPAARVTPRGMGTMVVLKDVQVTADSVTGWAEGTPDPSGLLRGPRTRVAMHRSEVLLFEPATPDNRATAGSILLNGLLGAAVVALYLISQSAV